VAPPPPIGLKIKRARERMHMTQAELGAAVRKSQKTIDNWEHDRSYPKSSIGALEAVLGVSLGEDTGSGFRVISPALRKMVQETLKDPDDQRRVLGLLEGTITWPEHSEGEAQRQRPAAG